MPVGTWAEGLSTGRQGTSHVTRETQIKRVREAAFHLSDIFKSQSLIPHRAGKVVGKQVQGVKVGATSTEAVWPLMGS